jgi:hypothetical protein
MFQSPRGQYSDLSLVLSLMKHLHLGQRERESSLCGSTASLSGQVLQSSCLSCTICLFAYIDGIRRWWIAMLLVFGCCKVTESYLKLYGVT